ncbi:glycosyltransferase [Microvirga sp. BT688]|uniref:glycosyltransferase family 2 protein n=1 Tax=Microvirga sp. TaxID=1873136 RepID=UPI00168396DA|nr:glycosyltransferase [Microvirga sp.]MBD2750177.1 glycosyltransferase [Microvirga sp.]
MVSGTNFDAPLVGAVAIGRNEGQRLRRCLESIITSASPVVYVDSGSTDGSVALASSLGCEVVILDPNRPFTAAAARNAGLKRLLEINPACEFVQFVDGDCEVVDGWIDSAARFLWRNDQYAVACGRRRERHPQASLYNRLCDLEWNTPVGEADACGGDAMMRVRSICAVGGFDGSLIAGEEPELCSRMRKAGWCIMRLDAEMTLHDAAMVHFSQWWRRTNRAGWAFVNGTVMGAQANHRRWLREAVRPWLWCVAVPASSAVLVSQIGLWGLTLLSVYPLIVMRAASTASRCGGDTRTALAFGLLSIIGKFAELQGQLTWMRYRLLQRPQRLIEYKRPG